MTLEQNGGLVDLEKELTCSICTDTLYQPLTLLDCLHTFCGACLKEWFYWQGSNATTEHPYTCPSCRATVRDTRPNATVTSLLDLFLQAYPNRGKTDEEKADQRKNYKPGDNVTPRIEIQRDSEDEDDRRLLEEVRELSLREVGVGESDRPSTSLGQNTRLHVERPSGRSRSTDARSTRASHSQSSDRREDRSHQSSRSRQNGAQSARGDGEPQRRPSTHQYTHAAQLEHQSSLRSLLSSSDIDAQELEQEIIRLTRQIEEEGLLDGIDLNNIDVTQEDEISERIAQAYRRRMREKQQERQERRERQARASRQPPASTNPTPDAPAEEPARNRPQRGDNQAPTQTQANRPPVSRPHLMESANGGQRRHHRSSSQGSSRSVSFADGVRRPSDPVPEAARSTGELSSRRRPEALNLAPEAVPHRRRMSHNDRSTTDPERLTIRDQARVAASEHAIQSHPNSPRRNGFPRNNESTGSLPAPEAQARLRRTTEPVSSRPSRGLNPDSPLLMSSQQIDSPTTVSPELRGSPVIAPSVARYPEPSVSCKRCSKSHIEYDLHYHCSRCEEGNYNICQRCYRSGQGCLHWFGFGYAAWAKYERLAPAAGYPPDHPTPHILTGHRYIRPTSPPQSSGQVQNLMTEENPADRLQAGVFCEMCGAFANTCYWKCDVCNEGAWGFCNTCVNQGRHCTHPLLPLNQIVTSDSSVAPGQQTPSSTTPQLIPGSASLLGGPAAPITVANISFHPLTFTTDCDICHYPIPPSRTRFHCPKCNNGDYDICSPCYHSLETSGLISSGNGPHGWRRCLQGHRMIVVGFEDRGVGQRRIVTNGLVGGIRWREELDGPVPYTHTNAAQPARDNQAPNSSTSQAPTLDVSSGFPKGITPDRFPPEGSIGWRVIGLWGYYPGEGDEDELMFPKNAEIREAFSVNEDWYWGTYAGGRGLFPGNYGRVSGTL